MLCVLFFCSRWTGVQGAGNDFSFIDKLGRAAGSHGTILCRRNIYDVYMRMCGCNKAGLARAWLFLKFVDKLT